MNAPQQLRVQLTMNEYHDLVTFQAHDLLQAKVALAGRDAQIQQLAQQLAEAKKANVPQPPLEAIVNLVDGKEVSATQLNAIRLYLAQVMLRQGAEA